MSTQFKLIVSEPDEDLELFEAAITEALSSGWRLAGPAQMNGKRFFVSLLRWNGTEKIPQEEKAA